MMTKHYSEPWIVDDRHDDDEYGNILGCRDGVPLPAFQYERPSQQNEANAERAVACVNALAGLNPEALPEFLQCAEALLLIQPLRKVDVERLHVALTALRQPGNIQATAPGGGADAS